MIYYFVDDYGMYIHEEDNVRGYYNKYVNPNMFTSKRAAIAEAKRQVKERVREFQERLNELRAIK